MKFQTPNEANEAEEWKNHAENKHFPSFSLSFVGTQLHSNISATTDVYMKAKLLENVHVNHIFFVCMEMKGKNNKHFSLSLSFWIRLNAISKGKWNYEQNSMKQTDMIRTIFQILGIYLNKLA